MIYKNLWGSVVSFTNDVIDAQRLAYPDTDINFLDWEAHANIHELPNTDLIGSTAVTITEDEPEFFSVSFTLAMSSYADDNGLFRLRDYVNDVFMRLRPGSKIPYCDHQTAAQLGWLHITDGTIVMPMTRADIRPLQFVQCHATLDATTALH